MIGFGALAALLGAGMGGGALLVGLAGCGLPDCPSGRRRRPWGRRGGAPGERWTRRVALATLAALAVGGVTGWPAGAVFAALGGWALPRMLGRDRRGAAQVARIEAVAAWTEMLRDTLAAAAGLEQAILAAADAAPAPIRPQVAALAARLRGGERLAAALRAFAVSLDDPTGDLVTAALTLAAEHQARDLGALLGSLAAAAREQAGMRLRIAAGRARIRTSVRVVVVTTVALAGCLAVFNRAYLRPYDSPSGQLALVCVGGLFAAGFGWLARMAAPAPAQRFLTRLDQLGRPDAGAGR